MRLIILLSLLAAMSAALGAGDPVPSPSERARVIQLLRESQKEFLAAVENLSQEAWTYKPAPDRWSVAEVSEHIMLAEETLFGMAQKALGAPANPEAETRTAGKTEFLERVMVDRSRRAQAPESVKPLGLARAEILDRYQGSRARTMKFIEATTAGLKAHTADHPFPVFGTLNAYQWILYIPLHNIRHNQQIAEVKASSGFPR